MDKYYFTSESVTEGHPDKLCDYIADKILDECLRQDKDSRVAVEVMASENLIVIAGEITSNACDETENYMPYAIEMAHRLAKRLTEVRKNKEIDYLRPDGKTQVTVEYENNVPKRIETILISVQHLEEISLEQLRKDIIDKVINTVIPKEKMDKDTKIYINPTGRFVIGGPLGDTGVTRKKNHS